MKEHIIEILDKGSLAGLNQTELSAMHAHASACVDCQKALEAAYLSAALLKARTAESDEVPPFFQTKVLAMWRERQRANEIWGFGRMWRSAGALVSSMAATVAMLVVLTFLSPATEPITQSSLASAANGYSAEEIVLGQDEAAEGQISDSQVLNSLYEDDTAVK